MGHKEEGKQHFQNEDYEQALASYRAALSPDFNCPPAERQILLSVRCAVILLLLSVLYKEASGSYHCFY